MGKKILLIEDNKPIGKVYKDFLEKEGFEVETIYDGKKALARLKEEKLPDVVLLDLVLPNLSGEEVLREMNDAGLTKKVPVIIVSVKTDEANAEKCLNLWGAKDYLIKSNWSLNGLKKKIESHLDK